MNPGRYTSSHSNKDAAIMTEPRKIKVTLMATATKRSILTPRLGVWDGKLGSVECQAKNVPDLEAELSRQARALLLYPAPLYRQLPDGRGLIARITGAEPDGSLNYALEYYDGNGRGRGSTHSSFSADSYLVTEKIVRRVTIDSEPREVESALKALIEHDVARYASA